MKICVVHNEYSKLGGEDVMVNKIVQLLTDQGHTVTRFTRTSADIPNMRFGALCAFFSGIHSPAALRRMKGHLIKHKPDVAMIQNVFPFISTSVFPLIRELGIPIVFRCGNFRLACPNGLLLSHGRLCEKCVGGKEYWCVLRNCEKSLPKSLGYAMRCAWTRLSGNVTRNTDMYVTQTQFSKDKFIEWGLPKERIEVIPNFVEDLAGVPHKSALGDFIGFAGRVSPEKDISTLLRAARRMEGVTFKVAGDYSIMPEIVDEAPANVDFLGRLDSKCLDKFYSNCRLLVLTSICYEVFPVVLIEAMAREIPIVCSRIGGLPSIVDDQRTGLLFEPKNGKDLTKKLRYLWNSPDVCRKMGKSGREKVMSEYRRGRHYERLMAVFERAIRLSRNYMHH